MPQLKPESVSFVKELESRSEITLKTLEDKTTQLKNDIYYSTFGQGVPRRNDIGTLRENLDNYFGEESDMAITTLNRAIMSNGSQISDLTLSKSMLNIILRLFVSSMCM
jgi:hypothetical protein